MVKCILFSLILTTLCIAFEVNGLKMKIKSTNPFTNNYPNYKNSSDSILETNTEYVFLSHFENQRFDQSQIRTNTSNPNLKPKKIKMISENYYTILNEKNNTKLANETSLQIRNFSSDMGRNVIDRTSSLAQPQNNGISRLAIQEKINIQQFTTIQDIYIDKSFKIDDKKNFELVVINTANNYRHKYKLEPLYTDREISGVACAYLDLYSKEVKTVEEIIDLNNFVDNPQYGINIYQGEQYSPEKGEDLVNNWYNEIKEYKKIMDNEDKLYENLDIIGNFTQLLWIGSAKIGVCYVRFSKKIIGSKYYIISVLYQPKGNVQNKFKQNLPNIKNQLTPDNQENQDNQGNHENQENQKPSSGKCLTTISMDRLIIFLIFII